MRFNILSVDEFGMTGMELSGMLKKLDVQIQNVKDETELVNAVHEKKYKYNIIVWTINSIDMKDFDVIKKLKEKDSFKNMPVIIISKFTDKKYIIKAIETGAVEYIAKPYDEETVLKKFCKALGVPFEKKSLSKFDEDFVTYNFSEMFNREIKAASRGAYPLTIMMVSSIAKTEEALEQDNPEGIINIVNRVLKTKLRETDTTFCYGTGNIILLLPFADRLGAQVVENKIMDIFQTHSVIKSRNKGCILVMSSVTFPDDGKIKGRLMEKLERNFAAAVKHAANAGAVF